MNFECTLVLADDVFHHTNKPPVNMTNKQRCFFSIFSKHLAKHFFIVFLLNAPNQSNMRQSLRLNSKFLCVFLIRIDLGQSALCAA